jgi:hypothetical protein
MASLMTIGNAPDAGVRRPLVLRQMENIANSLDALHSEVLTLDNKLQNVMTPAQPSCVAEKAPSEPCELAEQLAQFNRRIEEIFNVLRSQVNRLEI